MYFFFFAKKGCGVKLKENTNYGERQRAKIRGMFVKIVVLH
jgi:hypothetical protein